MSTRKWRIAAAGLALAASLAGCSLDVGTLPVNEPPVLGEIHIEPPSLAPLDTLSLSVPATDPDGDELHYAWSAQSYGQFSEETGSGDSLVRWIAPASLAGIESITFAVSVYDFDITSAVRAERTLNTEAHAGSLRVDLVDLRGEPAFVRELAALGVDTLSFETPQSSFTFDSLPWGNQAIVNLQDETYHGATDLWPGWPDTVNVHPNTLRAITRVLAPRSVVLIPGVVGEGLGDELLDSPQEGIEHAEAEGLDSVLLRRMDYDLNPVSVNGGTAALAIGERDLFLAPFPGDGPLWLDAGETSCDYGLQLSGRGEACRIEDLALIGAADAGVMLDGSGGSFARVRVADCTSKGFLFRGQAENRLLMEDCEILGGEYGLWQEGGVTEMARCLVAGCSWYGIHLLDGAAATLERLTLTDHLIAGIITRDAGPVTLEHGIVSGCGTGAFTHDGASPALDCNLFWNNGENLQGVPPGELIEEDPLFCAAGSGDWRVETDSPALVGPCGELGALGDCDSPDSPFEGGP